jgi:tetratricopeptide (TPR) repeat protein
LANVVLPAQTGAQDDYSRGKAALESKRYQEAEEAFGQAEMHSPGTTGALAFRAQALIHLNRFEEAQHCLNEYLKTHAHSADAEYLLAYVLFRMGKASESLKVYTAAAALERPRAEDFKVVGLDYVLLNDYPDAVRWLERAVSEGPKDSEAFYSLGRTYYVQNNFDKAIDAFQHALQLDPRDRKAQNNLGLAFAAKNQPINAEAAYRKAIQMEDESGHKSEQPYINLAELLSHTDRQNEALSLLDEAERIGGKSEHEQQVRGEILLEQNRLAAAEDAFRIAISLKRDSAALHYLLGRVLSKEGRSKDADQEFAESKALREAHSSTPN